MSSYPARCPARNLNGRPCANPAGHGTRHPGLGTCIWHRGGQQHAEEAWAMAQELAAERDITPHEALLSLVRTAATRAAWTDSVIVNAMREHVDNGGDPLKPPTELAPWLKQSREERKLAAATAKQAVDAGVMAALERRLDLEGELVATVLGGVLDSLNLDQEQRIAALGTAQQLLLEAGAPAAG
ncbi:hypothetical protein [Streptomyces caniscabiei]|uniref:hypothetical protein n=1 Tax=Streptomyces caniscabiei TaxID=2746961 RepID=UPI001872F992|nr:hypothetical protein [Streptomyces caniscabiei]MBE4796131.1 hypothetical protein [Streptomyces caniscabiei]MDX2944436.1 hypothetical protein [Streptomyces caniscabiei]